MQLIFECDIFFLNVTQYREKCRKKMIYERQFGFVDKMNELNRNDTFEMQLYRLRSVIFTRIALRNLQSRNRVMYGEGHKRLLEETMRKFSVIP